MLRPRTLLPLLFSLLFASAAFADGHDLQVTLESPDAVALGGTYVLRGTVTNIGTASAHQVLVSLGAFLFRTCYQNHELGTLAPGESRTLECPVTIPESDLLIYDFRTGMSVSSIDFGPDADPYNDSVQKIVPIPSPPDLGVFSTGGIGKPGLPLRFDIHYLNRAHTTATGTVITITAPGRFVGVPDFCTVTENRATCNLGSVPRHEPGTAFPAIAVEIEAPDLSGHEFQIPISIHANEPDAGPASNTATARGVTYPTLFVTSTADSGSGTLRAALEEANATAGSEPLLIAFRIPPAGQAWQTIRLASPLPRITGRWVWIDGSTQTGYFGDTNPRGPEIELTGSGLADGNGFDVGICNTTISGLAINGFPRNGVLLAPRDCAGVMGLHVTENYIGTDPTGTRAVPNARGVFVDFPGRNYARVYRNVISGNARSGVWVASGVHLVTDNIIGLTPGLAGGVGNGASGVYVAAAASGTDVLRNHIGFNHHFGVGLDRNTTLVSMQYNSFQANHQMAIDWGLDALASGGPIPIPEITNVRFENGKTIIEGRHDARGTFEPYLTLYANDQPDPSGYGEGQYWLGEIRPRDLNFTFTVDADLRGKWITATVTHVNYIGFEAQSNNQGFLTTTSEFSRAVEVK